MANDDIGHIESELARVQAVLKFSGAIMGTILSAGIVIFIFLFTGLEGRVTSMAQENKGRIEEQRRDVINNSKGMERYEAIAREQERRLGRIEQDIKELKEGQGVTWRKLDQIILERSLRIPPAER